MCIIVAHMPTQVAMEIERDYTTKLIISDMGHGSYRHQLLRKMYPMDLTYTVGKEMTFDHPVLHEKVTVTLSLSTLAVALIGVHYMLSWGMIFGFSRGGGEKSQLELQKLLKGPY